jgi:hypothetical protein
MSQHSSGLAAFNAETNCLLANCATPCGLDTGSSSSGSSSGGSSCAQPGDFCSVTDDCCQSGAGVGSSGQVCIVDDGLCHVLCTASSQCPSGCCIKLQGQTYGDCGNYESGYTCL